MKTLLITAKMSRRDGIALSDKSSHIRALAKKPYPPGVHGPSGQKRMTDYGKQLREKQKAKRMYGLNERQFCNLFKKSVSSKGNSAGALLQVLEQRLDNVIYRAGFVKTRAAGRQAIGHAHFEVNGKKVNIPSYRVCVGEIIRLRELKRGKAVWKTVEKDLQKKDLPSWMAKESGDLAVKITSVPKEDDLKQLFDPKLIIEFYSRQ